MKVIYNLDIKKDSFKGISQAVKGYKGSKLRADRFNALSQTERIKQLRLKSGEVFGLGKRNIRCLSKEHEDRHPSMGFCEDTGGFHCFACGCSFDIFDIVGRVFHCQTFEKKYGKTVKMLVEAGADTTYHSSSKQWCNKGKGSYTNKKANTYTSTYKGKKNSGSRYDAIPDAMQKPLHNPYYYKITDSVHNNGGYCLGHLQMRGIEFALILGNRQKSNNCLGICDFADKYHIRGWEYNGALYLVFINDNGSVCRRWIGGAVDSHTDIRWWNSKDTIGIFNERDLYKNDVVFVCEGAFDALTVLAFGYNAVSINGIQNLNSAMDKGNIKAVVLMDNDDEGKRAARAVNANRRKGTELFVPDFLCDGYNGDSILAQFKDVNEVVTPRANKNLETNIDKLRTELSRLYTEALRFYRRRGR